MLKTKTLLLLFLLLSFTVIQAQDNNQAVQPNYKGKAILASALVPGWGQTILKNNLKGEIMLWTDGAIWLLYGGYNWYGNSRNRDAKNFASIYADANTRIRSDQYFRALERYPNAELYNEDIRRDARERYPNDPSAQNSYLLANGYFGDSTWSWQADTFRLVYWSKRRTARSAFTKAGFLLGGALLNRMVSMIDCAFFSKDLREKIGFVPSQDETGIKLVYRF